LPSVVPDVSCCVAPASGVLDDVRMLVEHLAHVPVLFFDLRLHAAARPQRRRLLRERGQALFLLFQARGSEVTDDEANGGPVHAGLHCVGMDEAVVITGGFG